MNLYYPHSTSQVVAHLDREHILEHWDHEKHLCDPEVLPMEELSRLYHDQFVTTMGEWLVRHGGISDRITSDRKLILAYESVPLMEREDRTVFAASMWRRVVYLVSAVPVLSGLALIVEPLKPEQGVGHYGEFGLRYAANHLFDAMQHRGFKLRHQVSDVGSVLRMKRYPDLVA